MNENPITCKNVYDSEGISYCEIAFGLKKCPDSYSTKYNYINCPVVLSGAFPKKSFFNKLKIWLKFK